MKDLPLPKSLVMSLFLFGFVCVLSNGIHAQNNSSGFPVLPIADCVFVRSKAISEPQTQAFMAFQRRVKELSGEIVRFTTPEELTQSDKTSYHLIIAGRQNENALVNSFCGPTINQYLTNETVVFRREQGYIIQGFPNYYQPGRHIIVVGCEGQMGTVLGVSDLTRGLYSSNGSTYLKLPITSSTDILSIDEGDPSFSYSANWFVDTQTWYIGGTGHYTITSSAQVNISFTGTNITLIYRVHPLYGIANWSIDGGSGGSGQLDMYSPVDIPQSSITLSTSLSAGPHTLTIAHSGLHNPSSGSPYYITIDAIQVTNSSTTTDTWLRFEKPHFEYRGEYILFYQESYNSFNNNAYREISPHYWNDQDWRDHIDDLLMARINRLYFYYWYSDLLYPLSTVSQNSVNQNKHQRMREMIDYAHKRGMEVAYMFSPTDIPRDIYNANTPIHAYNQYYPNEPLLNPADDNAWPVIKDVYRYQVAWFKDADAIQVWFYDPGGSFDSTSMAQQHLPLVRQVEEFYNIATALNPKMRIEFNLWPYWAIENGPYSPGFYYVTGLLNKIKSDFGTVTSIRIMSYLDGTYEANARSLGYKLDAFLYDTNHETGYPFLHPMLDNVRNSIFNRTGMDGIWCMRLEARTKFPNTFFVGEWAWNPNYSKEQVVGDYANWVAGPDNGPILAQALFALDSVSSLSGSAKLERELELSQLPPQIFSVFPRNLQEKYEWLQTSLEAVALLAAGAKTNDTNLYQQLSQDFYKLMLQSPTFNDFAVRYGNGFSTWVGFIRNGGVY